MTALMQGESDDVFAMQQAQESTLSYARPSDAHRTEVASHGALTAVRDRPKRRRVRIDVRLAPLTPAILAICDLELLPAGWAGAESVPATEQAIATAIRVIDLHQRLLRTPRVGARADGGVHLEWCEPSRLELDVEPTGEITVVCRADDKWQHFEFGSPASKALHEQLARVERY